MSEILGRLGNLIVGDGVPTAIMGVINRDPNSFFRGSYYRTLGSALAAVEGMIDADVAIIDVGGVSTAPGAAAVSLDIEMKRVIPLIKKIALRWEVPLSIDTQRSIVAQKALECGATIVNDVSGLKADSAMTKVIHDAGANCIVMASNKQPGDCHSITEMLKALGRSVKLATEAEISLEKMVVDPGIGFGKAPEIDFTILRNLQEFRRLKVPILVGVSRKSFIGHVLGYPSAQDRLAGTIAATAIAVREGVHIIRAHDIAATRDCIKIVEAIYPKEKM